MSNLHSQSIATIATKLTKWLLLSRTVLSKAIWLWIRHKWPSSVFTWTVGLESPKHFQHLRNIRQQMGMMGMMPGMMPGHLSAEVAKTGAGDHAPKNFISFLKRTKEIRGVPNFSRPKTALDFRWNCVCQGLECQCRKLRGSLVFW